MDNCTDIQQMLADYRTDLLSESKRRSVEAHLATCDECTRELRVLDEALALVEANVPQQEPPVGLWNGVRNRIESGERARPTVGTALRGWFAKPVHAASTAVAAAALAVVVALSSTPTHQVPARTAAANEYIQGHALYAAQAPFADRSGYLSLVAASAERGDTQ